MESFQKYLLSKEGKDKKDKKDKKEKKWENFVFFLRFVIVAAPFANFYWIIKGGGLDEWILREEQCKVIFIPTCQQIDDHKI
jgi:hypothetical protein